MRQGSKRTKERSIGKRTRMSYIVRGKVTFCRVGKRERVASATERHQRVLSSLSDPLSTQTRPATRTGSEKAIKRRIKGKQNKRMKKKEKENVKCVEGKEGNSKCML